MISYIFLSRLHEGYDEIDDKAVILPFKPARPPGIHLPGFTSRKTAHSYSSPSAFFKLFFTLELMSELCSFTNTQAKLNMHEDSAYGDKGEWVHVTPAELYSYVALLMYMSIIKAPSVEKYWSTATLYHGLWARSFMTLNRFKAISSFLKVVDPLKENVKDDKLAKVRFLIDFIRDKCQQLYQPSENISIDERMVRNKGRFSFRQYIRDKPTKWGFKLWVLADSLTGYTWDFEVYTGKSTKACSSFGLAYDVVMRLCTSLLYQGYRLFVDNFYTSIRLLLDLFKKGMHACGTVRQNRRGFPSIMKDQWEKKAERGNMRWVRQDELLTVQWKDSKCVTLMSTMHNASNYSFVHRRLKENDKFRKILVRQPSIISSYNINMAGVDKSDQLIGKYNCLRKTNKWWKTLFYHLVDICRVNSFVLFKTWQAANPDIPELVRSKKYSQLEFTEELIRELANVEHDDPVPLLSSPRKPSASHQITPEYTDCKRNCKFCYKRYHTEVKTYVKCSKCDTYLCFNKDRNCLLAFHL